MHVLAIIVKALYIIKTFTEIVFFMRQVKCHSRMSLYILKHAVYRISYQDESTLFPFFFSYVFCICA